MRAIGEILTGDSDEARARDKFGGANLGAGFFGWIVAIGVAVAAVAVAASVATLPPQSSAATARSRPPSSGRWATSLWSTGPGMIDAP